MSGVIYVRRLESSSSYWPNGDPVNSITLPDGRTRYELEDGTALIVPPTPTYRIEYLSTFAGVAEGETYDVPVTLTGRCHRPGSFEVWNYDLQKARNYMFSKLVRATDLVTGEEFSGPEFELAWVAAVRDHGT